MADWRTAAAEKRQSLIDLTPAPWVISAPPPPDAQRDITGDYIRQYLTKDEVGITESDVSTILRRVHEGQWKARDIAEAFCHRAALAHQMTNCLHEIFFDAALDEAQKLDDYFAATGQLKGPLHGLPISLKDQFHVRGVETTMGYVGWIGTFQGRKGTGKEMVFESELVRELRHLGAVLYCKTSVPHTLMSGETFNNIVGYVPNPKNRLLSAGGSSGGEGALLGLRGSPLGVGTDIGGSVRFPSGFNGLYGLRPSSGRFPYEGMANSMDGQSSVLSVLGPMAHSIEAVKVFTEAVLSQQPWLHDPLVVELPWRASLFQNTVNSPKPFVFGILACDGYISVQPPVQRGLKKMADTLKSLGHIVLAWEPPSHKRAVEIASRAYTLDGGRDVFGAFALSKEPMSSPVVQTYGRAGYLESSASEIAALHVKKREYQKEYMDYWNSTSALNDAQEAVTAVIAPISPFAAPQQGKFGYYGYATFVNVLDYSAITMPTTTCDRDVDVFDEHYVPMNALDEEVWKDYDANVYHGAPVGLQLVGRRFEEEKILGLATVIARALQGESGSEITVFNDAQFVTTDGGANPIRPAPCKTEDPSPAPQSIVSQSSTTIPPLASSMLPHLKQTLITISIISSPRIQRSSSMVEPWLQLQAQHTAHAQTAAAIESTRNAWSQHHENDDARVRYTATYDDVIESLRKRYTEPAPNSWLAGSTPSQDQDPDSFPAALDALFARLKARDAEAADIEAMIAREKARWYRRTLRDAAAGTQAERLMGRQAYLSALEGHADEGHAANGTTTEAGAAPTNSSSTTTTAAAAYDWAAAADAIHRALTSQAANAPSVDDVLAKLATAGSDAAPRAEAYIDLFLRDPATGALPASCAAAAASLRAGTPLDAVFARLAADAAASTGTAAARAQADQHRRKLAELRRAQAAHLRDKAVKAETRQRRLRQQQQGPRVDAEVYENLPDGVAVGDVRACALCQVLAGLGVGTQKVYRTPERLAETHDDHIRSEHRCAAAEDCVQLTDEDVDMAGSDGAAGPAICKECAETQSHAVVYCSTRCAAAHFRQHRETVHVPGRRRDSSKSVEHDAKDLVFEDDDRSKYHAEDITKFVWTLNDALERFFKGKNPDVKILSID